jgi:hypothetical protein
MRLVNDACPLAFGHHDRSFHRALPPAPTSIAAVIAVPACATALPLASVIWTTGCCAKERPMPRPPTAASSFRAGPRRPQWS